MEHLAELLCKVWLLALLSDIRLGWKQLTLTNTLGYCYREQITSVKSVRVKVFVKTKACHLFLSNIDQYKGQNYKAF